MQKIDVSSLPYVLEFLINAVDAYAADITIIDYEYVEKSIHYIAILVIWVVISDIFARSIWHYVIKS